MDMEKSEVRAIVEEVLNNYDIENAEEVADSVVDRLDEAGLFEYEWSKEASLD